MKLTLAITVFNRYDLLLESFANVIDDHRIDEILIMDDCSKDEYWNKIKELPKFNDKIKVVRQLENRGMLVNKRDAVFNSKNELVIIFDSDNVIGKDYLDALEVQIIKDSEKKDCAIIYAPSFARPNFNYQEFEGQQYYLFNKPNLNKSMLNCLFNTCNYVVPRSSYLIVWQENKEMRGSDTIWFNYLWIKHGHKIKVVPNMSYSHRVHKDSGFMQEVDYNMRKAEEIKKLIMEI